MLVELTWLKQRRSRSASFPVVRSTPRPGVEDDGLGDRAATREGRSNPRNHNRHRCPAAEADWAGLWVSWMPSQGAKAYDVGTQRRPSWKGPGWPANLPETRSRTTC